MFEKSFEPNVGALLRVLTTCVNACITLYASDALMYISGSVWFGLDASDALIYTSIYARCQLWCHASTAS